jgi:hypothetical protein
MKVYGLLFALEAVRIWIYMNCFRICIGSYRFPKRVVVIAFSILWIFECSLIATTPLNNKALLSDTIIFCAEVVFCLLVSWCHRGKAISHLLFPVLLPTVYWGGKWVLISSFFQIRTLNSRQYLATTSVMVLLLFLLTGVWGKAWKSKQELEHELLEREVCMYEKQFEVIRQSQHSVRSLKHDMKHHIKMLADMVANGENESALKYLSDMGAFMENSEEYVSTGNERIDSILNYMIGKAKTANVKTEWKIQLPEHLDISTFDINIILGNLVENALNALSEVQSPYLNILMKYERGILCISIQNNCMDFQMPNMKDMSILPTANEHGYGLKNVRRVAEKYNGDLTITYENHIFTASVLLFIVE